MRRAGAGRPNGWLFQGLAAALAVAGGMLATIGPGVLAEVEIDGMPPGPGRDEVHAICSACHSINLVNQQRLSRQRWDQLLDWMVEKQGMPEPDPAERALILDYLELAYGPDVPR